VDVAVGPDAHRSILAWLAQRKRHIDVFGSTQKGGREILRACPKITESTFERVKYGFTTKQSYHMLWW
jgi:hypothetical protein